MKTLFAFETFSEFLIMGNHGFYVWSSYGLAFGLISLLVGFSYLQFYRWHNAERVRLARLERQKLHQQQGDTGP